MQRSESKEEERVVQGVLVEDFRELGDGFCSLRVKRVLEYCALRSPTIPERNSARKWVTTRAGKRFRMNYVRG